MQIDSNLKHCYKSNKPNYRPFNSFIVVYVFFICNLRVYVDLRKKILQIVFLFYTQYIILKNLIGCSIAYASKKQN